MPLNLTPIPLIQLAPMEGVLDWILREQLSEVGGVDRMVTEFIRVTDKLLPDHIFFKYSPELNQGGRTRCGVPVFLQLLGGQAQPMAENAARAIALGAPGIDLNFGCPAKTVNRHDGGAILLKSPQRLFTITQAVRAAVPAHIPVTAKVRLGFDHKDLHREIAQAVEEAGANHIVVHARTRTEMYTPPAHWHIIASMRTSRKIPFLANGEIWNTQDYQNCVTASGVQRVALGRGLVRSPMLAWQIKHSLGLIKKVPHFDAGLFLERFFSQSQAYRGDAYAVARMKQMLRYWSSATPLFFSWFQRCKTLSTAVSMRDILTEYRKELHLSKEATCPSQFASTLGQTAPTVFVP